VDAQAIGDDSAALVTSIQENEFKNASDTSELGQGRLICDQRIDPTKDL
jgi:hypothetical protein